MLKPSPSDLIEARRRADLTISKCCALTGKRRATWQQMEHGQLKVDLACLRLLELIAGDLSIFHSEWTGWRLDRDGKLYMPGYRQGVTPDDVLRLPWLQQLAEVS